MTAKDYSTWTAFALENKYQHLKAIINNRKDIEVHVTYPAYPYTKGTDNQRVVIPVKNKDIKKAAVETLEKELEEVLKHWNEKAKEE